MARYKFIGTKQDLIDNGFVIAREDDNGYFAMNKNLFYLYIKHGQEDILVPKEVYLNIRQDIKDLIDKGLVEEIK